MKLLVCFAVPEEAAPFRAASPQTDGLQLLITGMGHANCMRSFLAAADAERPRAVLTCGFAGGLNPDLRTGDVLYETPAGSPLGPVLREAGARPAEFCCVHHIAITPEAKRALRQEYGADAVEMESGHIVQECERREIPCATLRVILDPAGERLPLDFNRVLDGNQRMHYGKLALAILRHPRAVPGLMKLGRDSKAAAQRLAEVLNLVVSRL